MNIIGALDDAQIFGSASPFRAGAKSWASWRTALKSIYGLPLDRAELEEFKAHTGLPSYDPPPGGWKEFVAVVGRQAGKTRIGATIAAYEAANVRRAEGGELWAIVVGQDLRASVRAVFSYLVDAFESSPVLRRMVVSKTTDPITLRNGVKVAAYPCRPSAVRGLRAAVVVADELGFYRSTDGNPVDTQMLHAVRPTLAMTGGKLICLSSPYARSGALYELHRHYHAKPNPDTLVWQASAPQMNASLPADYLRRMKREDPDAYRAEVLGEFRSGTGRLFDPDMVQLCVARGIRERGYAKIYRYVGFVDPSGGRSDGFTCAIGHTELPASGRPEEARGVVDVVRCWPAPFSPESVVAECCHLLRSYAVHSVQGDRYSAEFVVDRFRAYGISYRPADKVASDLYLELLGHVNSQRIEIPDEPNLIRELITLERARGSMGRDRVRHPPNAHDDRANALAGAARMLLSKTRRPIVGVRF